MALKTLHICNWTSVQLCSKDSLTFEYLQKEKNAEEKKNKEGKGGEYLEMVNIFFEEEKKTKKEKDKNIRTKFVFA